MTFLAAAALAEGSPHSFRLHRETDLLIYALAEDPSGKSIWVAAEQGLYQFAGFRFARADSYPFPTGRFLGFTADGSLWIAGRHGLARRHPNGRFQVVLRSDFGAAVILPDRLFGKTDTLVEIDLQGHVTPLSANPRGDLLRDTQGDIYFVDRDFAAYRIPAGQRQPQRLDAVGDFEHVFRDSQSRLWAANDQVATRAGSPESIRHKRVPAGRRPGPLLPGRTGPWFIGDELIALSTGLRFAGPQAHKAATPMAALEDSHGRLWVARRGLGLVEWIVNPRWDRWYPEDFELSSPVQIVHDEHGAALLVTRDRLYRFQNEAWRAWGRTVEGIAAALPLDRDSVLVSIQGTGVHLMTSRGAFPLRSYEPDAIVHFHRDRHGRVLAVSDQGQLYRIAAPGPARFEHIELPRPVSEKAPAAIALARDGALVAAHQGQLSVLGATGEWQSEPIHPSLPALRHLAFAGESTAWAAGWDAKLYRLVQRSGVWEGLAVTSPNPRIAFVRVDARGWVWTGGPAGVFLCDGQRWGPRDWLQLYDRNGLPAGGTTPRSFAESGGAIWLATSGGVARLRPDASWFRSPSSAVPRVVQTGPASFVLHSVGGPLLHANPYQFRVSPGPADWSTPKQGEIELGSLAPGSYTLHVATAGTQDRVQSAIAIPGTGVRYLRWIGWTAVLLSAIALWHMSGERLTYAVRKGFYLRRYRHGVQGPDPHTVVHTPGEVWLNRYRLVKPLARGGFSRIFEALDLQNGEARVAVKVLMPTTETSRSWNRDAFAQEVAALRSIRHPGIVPILDSWVTAAGEPCLAMPYLDGPTLREAAPPLPPHRCARIVRRLGEALDEIHRRGIVHRDIKPENVVLLRAGEDDEQPVLVDFGTAGLVPAYGELAVTTQIAGSFHYLAPERLSGHYSPASDVFSFAVVTLELVTGRRLSDMGRLPSDPEFLPDLTEALRPVLGSRAEAAARLLAPALEANPRSRPQAVGEWSARLAWVIDQCPGLPSASASHSSP